MLYEALKECRYDRKYYPGEVIDASVIDASIVDSAVKYGYIRRIHEVTPPAEPERAAAAKNTGRRKGGA